MEMILFAVDRVSDDPYMDALSYKRGDVIMAKPDGWPWSMAELTNPDWRIIKFPSIAMDQAASFVAPEAETDPRNPNRMRQRRGFRLNFDALPGDLQAYITDSSRSQPFAITGMTAQDLNALRKRRPRRQDPNVLG